VDDKQTTPSWIADRRHTDSLKWSSCPKTGILPLWVADMDFRSAEPIIEALRQRVEEGVFGYAKESDRAAEAVVHWLWTRHGRRVHPEWIVWMPGVVPGLHVTCRAFSEPGEGVFTFTPIYPPFLWSPEASGRRTVTCPLTLSDGRYEIDFDAFRASLTNDTKVLLLCSPHNPVGRVWTKDELTQIAKICLKRNILLCSDEIHCDLLLDRTVRHIPTAALSDEISDRCVTLMSAAKTFNLPGLNCGFAIIPNPSLRKRFKETAMGIVPHVNIFGYTACRAAYTHGTAWLEEVLDYLRQNHDLLYTAVNSQLPGLSMGRAEATYLAWLDCRKLNLSNLRAFFDTAGVGLMDGAAFGQPGFMRLNFACSREHLTLAIDRIKTAIAAQLEISDQ
jgi:cystathionine beta-lyase